MSPFEANGVESIGLILIWSTINMAVKNLNPNHPASQAIDGQWLKIMAIYMHSRGLGEVVITIGEIERMGPNFALGIQELEDGLHIRLMGAAEAEIEARKQGGLPT